MLEGLDMTLDELIQKNKKSKWQDGTSGGSGSITGNNRHHVYSRENRAPLTKRSSMDHNACITGPYFMLPPPPPLPPLPEHQMKTMAVRKKLHVSNLHFEVTENDIKVLFSDVGPLEHYMLYYDKSGRSKGTAEVVYKHDPDAVKAFRRYNNLCLDGRRLKIEFGVEINTPTPKGIGLTNGPNGRENYTGPSPRYTNTTTPVTQDTIRSEKWAKFKHVPKGGLLRNLTATYGSGASSFTNDTNRNQKKFTAREKGFSSKNVTAEALDADLDNYIKRQRKFGI